MSNDVGRDAWKTKFGNSPAKMVLVMLSEVANNSGFGWPSLSYVCDRTELSERQVQRVLQVFQEIGLIQKTKTTLQSGKIVPAFQINLELLGRDLCAEFRVAFLRAQGKLHVSETVNQPVSETAGGVSETEKGVSETPPPHPLYGGTVREPSGTASGVAAALGECNVHPTIVSDIVDVVMRGCEVSNRRRRPAVTRAVKLALMLGESPQALGAAMVSAWNEQAAMNDRGMLRIVYGIEAFFGDGKWNNPATWHWNHEKLDRQREARVGVW